MSSKQKMSVSMSMSSKQTGNNFLQKDRRYNRALKATTKIQKAEFVTSFILSTTKLEKEENKTILRATLSSTFMVESFFINHIFCCVIFFSSQVVLHHESALWAFTELSCVWGSSGPCLSLGLQVFSCF